MRTKRELLLELFELSDNYNPAEFTKWFWSLTEEEKLKVNDIVNVGNKVLDTISDNPLFHFMKRDILLEEAVNEESSESCN